MTDRKMSVGASEVAALFGCSPWQSEYGLWLLKTGLAEEQPDTERLRAGRYLEKAILEEWKSRHAYSYEGGSHGLFWNTNNIRHKAHAFISATPDAVGFDHDGDGNERKIVGDVKTVTAQRRQDWHDGVPEYYRLQLQQQMLVTGASRAVLIAQFGFDELASEWINADASLQEEIVKRVSTFWRRVQGELPPPEADGHDATTDALRRRKLQAKAIVFGDDVREWTQILTAAEKREKENTAVIAEMKNKIRAALGDADTGVWADGTGWRVQTITRKESVTRASTYTALKRIKNKDAIDASEVSE